MGEKIAWAQSSKAVRSAEHMKAKAKASNKPISRAYLRHKKATEEALIEPLVEDLRRYNVLFSFESVSSQDSMTVDELNDFELKYNGEYMSVRAARCQMKKQTYHLCRVRHQVEGFRRSAGDEKMLNGHGGNNRPLYIVGFSGIKPLKHSHSVKGKTPKICPCTQKLWDGIVAAFADMPQETR
jgi:hypothetical protein